MGTAVLGWILVAIGIIGMGAGVVGGIATMFKEVQLKAQAPHAGIEDILPTKFLEALTKFLEALTKAPVWLALIIIGILLVAWGATMI